MTTKAARKLLESTTDKCRESREIREKEKNFLLEKERERERVSPHFEELQIGCRLMSGESCDWQNIYIYQQHFSEHWGNNPDPKPKTFQFFVTPRNRLPSQIFFFSPPRFLRVFLFLQLFN